MYKLLPILVLLSFVLTACGSVPIFAPTATAAVAATATEIPTLAETPSGLPTDTATPAPAPTFPPEGYGPSNFPADVDPLTGLRVANPALLERRPIMVKVSNLPRNVRPQWGLSLADIVFEYYTEEGATRYAAVFYGNDADMVGPIRSGRFIDEDIVRGYKAMFVFGYAYVAEMDRFLHSEFADRLVVEGPGAPLTRYDPKGADYLMANTADVSAYATSKGVNGKQNLYGMFFNITVPAGGQPVTQVFVRYSGVSYNSWQYDQGLGKYLHFSDTADDYNNQNEQYARLTDRLTDQPIASENVVVLFANHELYSPGIYDILLSGSGDAYVFRDGQAYPVTWHRNDPDVISLTNPDGTPFALKPGATWFEVIGQSSTLTQNDQGWRFIHQMP